MAASKLIQPYLSQALLREILWYCPATGVFTWRVPWSNRIRVGDVAGSANATGRKHISLFGHKFPSARLAWFYVRGVWPEGVIDHKDTNPSNDSFENLRDVSHQENIQNQFKPSRNSKSGLLGVTFYPSRGKWNANINIGKQRKNLGYFDTSEEAQAAYLAAKRRLHAGNLS